MFRVITKILRNIQAGQAMKVKAARMYSGEQKAAFGSESQVDRLIALADERLPASVQMVHCAIKIEPE